jgi:hypothetical protein
MATLELDLSAAPAGAKSETDLRYAVRRIAGYVLSTCDWERTDRVCPAHYQVFATNPMSVAHGAAGVALFLHRALGELPPELRRWMLDRPLDAGRYPPGLFVGLAGIGWALAEVGLPEAGEEAMRAAYGSPLLFDEPGVYLGAAGWGLAALRFWELTGRQEHFDHAVRAGEHLLATAEAGGANRFWRFAAEGKVHYGFGYGSAGIALFLLHLGLRTGRGDFLEAARQGLDHDLAQKLDTVNGTSWKRFEDDLVNFPYFIHGGAGIGAVVSRFSRLLDRQRYSPWLGEIADGLDMKWTIFPSLAHGLSGIGEFHLDAHETTGDPEYLRRARDNAEVVQWFRIDAAAGYAFPGRMLLRVSNDWATGSAGIGLFLHRLANGGPRLFLDLDPAAGPC